MSNEITTITKINVGTPGNIRTLSMSGPKTWTVGQVLNAAELSTQGYDIRVNGVPATDITVVSEGQTVLLLAPVRGNGVDDHVPTGVGTDMVPFVVPATIKINVGTPGNIRTLSLEAGRPWAVRDILTAADLSDRGYDLRVNGQPATAASIVTENQTVLLLAPVRGN
jgi:hypothetical protein